VPESGSVSAGSSRRREEPTGLGGSNIALAYWRARKPASPGLQTEQHHLGQFIRNEQCRDTGLHLDSATGPKIEMVSKGRS
jgi:hypothetical protein